jgi:hypothetical protein
VRISASQRVLIFTNFSEQEQTVPANLLRLYGLSYQYENLLSKGIFPAGDLNLSPLDFLAIASG